MKYYKAQLNLGFKGPNGMNIQKGELLRKREMLEIPKAAKSFFKEVRVKKSKTFYSIGARFKSKRS